MQSTRKIDDLEKTIETLSDAAISVTEAPKQTQTEKNKKTVTPKPTENPLLAEVLKSSATPKSLQELATPKPVTKPAKVKNTPKPKDVQTEEIPVMNQNTASYIVKAGDTLSQIVWRQYHTLSYMEEVKKVNHIEDGDKIMEGQTIILPCHRK